MKLGNARAGWQALSREGRDTLWLLGMLAFVMAPHVARLPWWASLGAVGALLWRARLAWVDGKLPPRWLMVALLITSLALTWLTHRTLMGREAGVTLIVILTTLKCLELRARRDSLVCLYLGFFLILTQFLFSQGLGTAVLMLLGVWGLLTALILGQRPLGRPPLREVGREAVRALLWGLPLMLTLFVLFPRLGPLWTLPQDARARTGLSNSMALGEVAELAQDDAIALRIRFLGRVPPPAQMYFRGPTMDEFDGRTWRPRPAWLQTPIEPLKGVPIDYDITIEPSSLQMLPLLEGSLSATVTGGAEPTALRQRGLDWFLTGDTRRRVQLRAQAWPQWRYLPSRQHEALIQQALALPQGFNPRTLAWAATFRQREGLAEASPRELATAVLRHIRQERFSYTLSPGLPADPSSRHLIDDFWLDSRTGFCEHFAASFVVVMRAMGVPARVVTGYQGADLNPVDGQYVVRNSNAHAWAEIWEPERGWTRVDPTAAVAPERVERSPQRPLPFAGLPGPLGELDPESLRQLRAMWEAVDHRWNVWVLQYSRGQQMALLRSLGWDQPDWQDLGKLLGWALAALGLGSSLVVWLTRERTATTPWQRPLARIHQALSTVSALPPPGPAPAAASAWRASLEAQWRQQAPQPAREALLRALSQVDALRYGAPAQVGGRGRESAKLIALVRHIEQLARDLQAPGAHLGVEHPP